VIADWEPQITQIPLIGLSSPRHFQGARPENPTICEICEICGSSLLCVIINNQQNRTYLLRADHWRLLYREPQITQIPQMELACHAAGVVRAISLELSLSVESAKSAVPALCVNQK
jgi:hypothetical protein